MQVTAVGETSNYGIAAAKWGVSAGPAQQRLERRGAGATATASPETKEPSGPADVGPVQPEQGRRRAGGELPPGTERDPGAPSEPTDTLEAMTARKRGRSRLAIGLVATLLALAVAVVVGLVVLWPDQRAQSTAQGRLDTLGAEVVQVTAVPCPSPELVDCRRLVVLLEEGPDAGTRQGLAAPAGVRVEVGDGVRVFATNLPPGARVGEAPADAYGFADFERRPPILWLAFAFALLVIATARWQGLRALVGLGASLAIVLLFLVPAILDGRSPLWVALVGALAVMLVTIPLGHGIGAKALAACLGTAISLLLTAVLARAAVGFAHLTGFASEEAVFLRATTAEVSIQGLLLAGMVIGALGVLDDLTVSQASTVMALRRANPALGVPSLIREGLRVGNDHIVATVNTLVLAYVGASLPALLVFSLADTSFSAALNSEVVATQVVAMLVGSIGLIAAVPVTTALAALLAVRLPESRLVERGHAHAH